MQLPEEYAARMQRMLGNEYEAFLASYERERRPSLRVNLLKAEDASMEPAVNNVSVFVKTHTDTIVNAGDDDGKSGADTGAAMTSERVVTSSDALTAQEITSPATLTTQESGVGFAAAAPWELVRVPWAAGGYSYAETDRPGKHAFHEAGVYYIQEASAMSVAALSGAQPGERILDLCAAPGGKTTQLAAMMQGRGVLVSNEIGPTRARILAQNVERMGIRNCIVTNETPAHLADRFTYYYDRVIVDAPCSGEGMFRSKDEALPLWSQGHVTQCAARQQDILDEAARMVGPGGTLVYSTCTFAPEEDEESVAAFLVTHPDYEIVDLPAQLGDRMAAWGFTTGNPDWCRQIITYEDPGDLRHVDDYVSERYGTSIEVPEEIRRQLTRTIRLFPHRMGGEGHFLAMLRKAGTRVLATFGEAVRDHVDAADHTARGSRKDIRGTRGDKHSRGGKGRDARGGKGTSMNDAIALWQEFVAENLTCDLVAERATESGSVLLTFGEELYLEPAGISLTGLKVVRPGLHLGTASKGRFTPSQALAEALHPEDAIRTWNIPDDGPEDSRDAAAYLRGESLPCDPTLKGWTLVTVSDQSGQCYTLGWGKAAGGMLKNHYPKGLRRPY